MGRNHKMSSTEWYLAASCKLTRRKQRPSGATVNSKDEFIAAVQMLYNGNGCLRSGSAKFELYSLGSQIGGPPRPKGCSFFPLGHLISVRDVHSAF
jgi:hypothetical protein